MQDMELQPEGAGRCLRVSRYGFSSRSGRVNEQGHDGRRGDQFMQQLQPLRPDLHVHDAHAREVAARAAQAGDKSKRERVEPCHEDNRNYRGCCLCWPYCRAIRDDHRHLMANEVGRQQRKSVVFVIRPAVFDREVLALDIASLFQAPMERGQEGCVLAGWPTVEEPDHRHRLLLRVRRERPRGCRAAEQSDELAALHVLPQAQETAS
jgi:hypothetical protein